MKMSQRLGNSQRTSWSLELLELWVPTFHLRPTRTPSRLFSPCPPENARTSQSKTLQWLSPSSNWSCSNGVLHLLHIWVDLLELQSRLNEVVATWDAENVDFHDMFFFRCLGSLGIIWALVTGQVYGDAMTWGESFLVRPSLLPGQCFCPAAGWRLEELKSAEITGSTKR